VQAFLLQQEGNQAKYGQVAQSEVNE
jgi:hypothetical protein